jgi:hypothetical protein
MAAVRTPIQMAAERSRAAVLDGAEHFQLLETELDRYSEKSFAASSSPV